MTGSSGLREPGKDAARAGSKYGPGRGELWFRLAVSLIGLAMMTFAVVARGVGGIAWVEVVALAGAFFGGSAVWTAWRLLHR